MPGVVMMLVAVAAVMVWARRGRMPVPVAFGLAMVFVLGAVAAELTDNVEDHDGITGVDPGSLDWIIAHRYGGLTPIAMFISDAGGTLPMTILAALAGVWFAWRRRWDQAALVAVATAGAGILVVTLKALVGRVRPPVIDQLVVETNPSGHSLGVLAAVLWPRLRTRPGHAGVPG